MLAFHPLSKLFPLIEGEHFEDLVADIRANGLREKIVLLDDTILDGRNRYRAARAAGLIEDDLDGLDRKRHFVRFLPEVDGDPLKFVLSKNLARRHLSESQRAMVAARLANVRQGRPATDEKPANLPVKQTDAAQRLNVSERLVRSAKVVEAQGAAELKRAVDQGDVAVSAAERIARLPEPEQQREVERLLPRGARAIMGSRQEPDDSLDYFPTPPWATRALVEVVISNRMLVSHLRNPWEPACGEGHIAEVLREYAPAVPASDIHDYGYGEVLDFLSDDALALKDRHDWIITNPPFGDRGEAFVHRALELAEIGVAMFLRMQWLETIGRYERLFALKPPTLIAFFAERVNLCKGRWDPAGGTATAYMWLIWQRGRAPMPPFWIPPGQRAALTRPDDAVRFTAHPVTRRPTDAAGHTLAHDGDGVVADDADIPAFLKREAAE